MNQKPMDLATAFPTLSKEVERLAAEKVAEQLKKQSPNPAERLTEIAQGLAVASLQPAEVLWLSEHLRKGAPGLDQFLQSDSIKTVVQMLFETYKDFLEGKVK